MTRKFISREASVATPLDVTIGGASPGPPIIAGDDATLRFHCTEQDGESPLDLSQSGEVVEWVAEDSSGTNTFNKSTDTSGVTIVSASDGIVEVTLSASDTSGEAGDLTYSLRLTDDGSGTVTTLAKGTLTIDAEVQR